MCNTKNYIYSIWIWPILTKRFNSFSENLIDNYLGTKKVRKQKIIQTGMSLFITYKVYWLKALLYFPFNVALWTVKGWWVQIQHHLLLERNYYDFHIFLVINDDWIEGDGHINVYANKGC